MKRLISIMILMSMVSCAPVISGIRITDKECLNEADPVHCQTWKNFNRKWDKPTERTNDIYDGAPFEYWKLKEWARKQYEKDKLYWRMKRMYE